MPVKQRPLGDRIRLARQDKQMSLEYLARETGKTEEYLTRIESNEEFPPVGMLLQLARALQVDTGTFLNPDGTEEQLPADREKRTDNYIYQLLTEPSSGKHLKAFDIKIPPRTRAREGIGYRHSGEEFAYVLEGIMEYTVGENATRLEKGGSIHFNSSIPHNLTNVGDRMAHLIVILYTP